MRHRIKFESNSAPRTRVEYLVAVAVLGIFGSAAHADLTSIASFSGGAGGYYPEGGLVQGSDGNFYGTTEIGGVAASCGTVNSQPIGCGTVFQLSSRGVITTLGSLDLVTSGYDPVSPLAEGPDGNFYGTANAGTVFRASPSGGVALIAKLSGLTYSGLALGPDGNFYGTTYSGGSVSLCYGPLRDLTSCGTVFKMTPQGTVTTLTSFDYANAGGQPASSLILGRDGNFYGTTTVGGTSGTGTIFRVTPQGVLTVLGSLPQTSGVIYAGFLPGLVQASDDSFYGVLRFGGSSSLGSIFHLTPDGQLTVVVEFDGSNGAYPNSSLVRAGDGSFYGTTAGNSITYPCSGNACGTVFKMTPDGAVTTLATFNGANGLTPVGPLVLASDGYFYGVTTYGGPNPPTMWQFPYDFGTAFKFDGPPPAAPSSLKAYASKSHPIIVLSWTASEAATQYNVYMGTAPGAEGTAPITTVTHTNAPIRKLQAGTRYYFKVTAVNAHGESSASAEAKATAK